MLPCRCHYKGRLASNNAIFDSSYERGRPLSFKIGVRQVIAGEACPVAVTPAWAELLVRRGRRFFSFPNLHVSAMNTMHGRGQDIVCDLHFTLI